MTFERISFKIEDIKGDWPTKEGRIRAVSGLDCGGVSGGRHCELRVASQAAREIAAGAAGGRGRFQRSELRAGAGTGQGEAAENGAPAGRSDAESLGRRRLLDRAAVRRGRGLPSIGDYAVYRDYQAEAAVAYKNEYFISPECIELPASVQRIGDYAFSGFRFAKGSIIMPENLKSIGVSAFKDAAGYIKDDIVIPSGVTSIGKAAFQRSELLFFPDGEYKGIVFPEDCAVAAIEEDTFRDCGNGIYVNTTNIHRVGSYAFHNAQTVDWPHIESIDDWGEYAFAYKGKISCLSDDYVYGGENIRYGTILRGLEENQVSLSSKVTTIPEGFELTATLPDTVKAISSHAFNSVVTDYRLSSSLTNIAVDAFPKGSTFVVDEGSYAELWCGENGFGYSIEGQDNLDWLNN